MSQIGVTANGRAYAYCDTCRELETRSTNEAARRWLDRHRAFIHTAAACTTTHIAITASASR